jgi:peptidoglycan hydrolase CwlO-like protein
VNFPFSNLNGAKEEVIRLTEQVTALEAKSAQVDTLSAANTDLATKLETTAALAVDLQTRLDCLTSDHATAMAARDQSLATKDAEIATLKASVAELKANQKTVKATARELVAASAGAPAPVDNAELELEGPALVKAMREEQDPQKLYALYELHKKQTAARK